MAQPTNDDLKMIANLYVALFNRAPDTAGLNFWATALANGASLNTISQGFLSAPEGVATYPSSQTGEAFLRAFYLTTFGRAADEGGLAFWQDLLISAGGADSTVARAFVVTKITELVSTPLTGDGATDTQSVQDRALFANKIEYGLFLATETTLAGDGATAATLSLSKVTSDASSVAALKAAALEAENPTVPPVVPPVTPPVDAALDVTRTLDELNEIGAIGGNATNDYLRVAVDGNLNATPANVRGFENIFVGTVGSDTFTVDTARFEGAKVIMANFSNNLVFNNLTSAQSGGVVGTGNPLGSTAFNFADNVTSGTVAALGLVGGKITIAGANLTDATLQSVVGPNTVSDIVLGSAVTLLTINASTSLAIPGSTPGYISGGAADLSIVITGAGRVALNANNTTFINANIHSLDASASAGGVEARLVGSAEYATTIVGSAASDVIRMTGGNAVLHAASSIDLGGGDDNFAGGVGTIQLGAVIDGGDGIDTLSAYSLRNRTSTENSAFKNFEFLSVGGSSDVVVADITTIADNNTISRLVMNGGTGGVTVNEVSAEQALYVFGVSSNTTTIGLAAPADEYTINFRSGFAPANSVAINAGTIAINAENLTLDSGGAAANKIKITDTSLESLNVTGAKDIEVTFGGTVNASINLKGDIALATGQLTLISTSADDSFGFNRAAKVSGGGGNDLYDVSGTAVQTADATHFAAKMVSITDFGADFEDTLSLVAGIDGGENEGFGGIAAGVGDTLFEAVLNAVQANESEALAISAFTYEAKTYIVADVGSFGSFDAGDVLVELTGTSTLQNAYFNVTTGVVSIWAA